MYLDVHVLYKYGSVLDNGIGHAKIKNNKFWSLAGLYMYLQVHALYKYGSVLVLVR